MVKEIKKLKEENDTQKLMVDGLVKTIQELKLERQRDTIDEARSARDKALSQVKELKTEVSDILKFIAGDFTYEEAVKDVIKRGYTKEFIDNNEERWGEVGIEWFEEEE